MNVLLVFGGRPVVISWGGKIAEKRCFTELIQGSLTLDPHPPPTPMALCIPESARIYHCTLIHRHSFWTKTVSIPMLCTKANFMKLLCTKHLLNMKILP